MSTQPSSDLKTATHNADMAVGTAAFVLPALAPVAAFAAKSMAAGALSSIGAKALDRVVGEVFPDGAKDTLSQNSQNILSNINLLSVGELDHKLDLNRLEELMGDIQANWENFDDDLPKFIEGKV